MARKKTEARIKLTNNEKLNVYIQCRNLCAHCGRHLEFHHDMTVDHVIPLNKGGKNEPRNYVALCKDCNQAKSDNVVYPIDYYPYLPEPKKKEVTELFHDYLRSTAWFAHDNVFMLDQFNLKTARAVYMPKQGMCYPVPTTMRVEKISQDDAFEYLQYYIARLTPEDKGLFVTSPTELDTPYYKITAGKETMMVISAYVDQDQGYKDSDDDRNIIRVDFFPNPDVKYREHTTHLTLMYILRCLIAHVHDTLMRTAQGTTMDLMMLTPQSDRLAKGAINEFKHAFGPMCSEFENPIDDKDIRNGGTIGIHMTLFQGTKKDIMKLAEDHNVKSLKELAAVADTRALQQPLDQALTDSEKRKESKPKYTRHKNDAKKKHRKSNKKRRT
ncbi:MAG: HNH endonuclease [Clostridia bacterium]|nr:HNH endonuclease [Clostridia bacterium]